MVSSRRRCCGICGEPVLGSVSRGWTLWTYRGQSLWTNQHACGRPCGHTSCPRLGSHALHGLRTAVHRVVHRLRCRRSSGRWRGSGPWAAVNCCDGCELSEQMCLVWHTGQQCGCPQTLSTAVDNRGGERVPSAADLAPLCTALPLVAASPTPSLFVHRKCGQRTGWCPGQASPEAASRRIWPVSSVIWS